MKVVSLEETLWNAILKILTLVSFVDGTRSCDWDLSMWRIFWGNIVMLFKKAHWKLSSLFMTWFLSLHLLGFNIFRRSVKAAEIWKAKSCLKDSMGLQKSTSIMGKEEPAEHHNSVTEKSWGVSWSLTMWLWSNCLHFLGTPFLYLHNCVVKSPEFFIILLF